MKRLRYILAILFSFLIIVSGAGVFIVQYCCAGCEVEQSCCTSFCASCEHSHHSPEQSCKDTGCTAVHYKVDMVKYASEVSSFIPYHTLFCEQLPQLDVSLALNNLVPESVYYIPPQPPGSRHYLALYSVLLI